MTHYQMTGILARAMDGDTGKALRLYLDTRFNDLLRDVLENGTDGKLPALKMIREIKSGLEGMVNALKMMDENT